MLRKGTMVTSHSNPLRLPPEATVELREKWTMVTLHG